MKYVTIKDVARALNISISSVSRAFNDKYDIRKETKAMILQKAKEMGYRPNPIAMKLIQKHSYNVGIIVPEFINPFFPEVIMGVQQVLFEKGYQVIIMQSNESSSLELKNLVSMENNRVEGLLISLSKETKNLECIQHLVNERFPIVLFNRVNEELPVSKVVFDDYKWALFATEHLIEQGYSKIYHLSGPQHLTLVRNRISGFQKALLKHNLPFNKDQVIETGFFIEDGELAMEKLIKEGNIPEAIFATNDPTAIGAMKVLKKHGYRIPEDVAIVGFSDTPMAEIVEPSLTSVLQPTVEMGKAAARLLLEQIEAVKDSPPRTIALDGKLIIRNSSVKNKGT